jgi:diguanylate cyclase (GGDEF)-like protein
VRLRSATARPLTSARSRAWNPLRLAPAVATVAAAALAGFGFATGRTALLLVLAIAGPCVAIGLYHLAIRPALEAGRLALVDQLTGLGNDRRFLERLERDLDRAELDGGSVVLCLLDVDDFKRVNDRYGHPTGDTVLTEVAAHLRKGGEAFRLGGDEFALLLPGCDEEEGIAIASAVLERIAAAELAHGGAVTASAGLAVFPSGETERSGLVRAADDALYRAKRDGKNRVRAYAAGIAESSDGLSSGAADHRSLLHAAGALARAIRARGIDAGGAAVGDLAARVAARMGLASEQIDQIRVAATLSDVGKLALPDELLSKAEPLTAEERHLLERHPRIGFQMLESLGADPLATWVLHHHERWDGGGYPERLAGERIPLGARILFVADAFEAMTTDQPWRSSLSREQALAELERCSGTQFDPAVVGAFAAELAVPAGTELAAAV